MKKETVINRLNPLFLKGIAHRGLHNEKLTENGMNAFKNALEHNVAIEFDIHLTKDNELVVCHDDNLKRTTGKDGIIEELTLKEIKDNYKLLDGGEIPTFKEVLDFIDEKIPMVIELKVHERNYFRLSKKALEALKNIKDYKNYMIISFDPRALERFNKTKFITSLLVCEKYRYVYKLKNLFDSIDIEYTMLKEESVKRYAKKHFVNVWTIENEEAFNSVLSDTTTITFQHMDCDFVQKALENKNKEYLK